MKRILALAATASLTISLLASLSSFDTPAVARQADSDNGRYDFAGTPEPGRDLQP